MESGRQMKMTDLLPGFREYLSAERRFSPTTIEKYTRDILAVLREIGDLPLSEIGIQQFISLKARLGERGVREARIAGLIAAMKGLLSYGRDVLKFPIIDLTTIKAPRPPRREVVYLTNEELDRFLEAIPLRSWDGKPRLAGYRFRALVETLAATGMRLSEVLSLNRDSIDFEKREATIVGKGNRERTVFFTDQALQSISRYLDLRSDRGLALFATAEGSRLTPKSVQGMFQRNTRWAGLEKRVTPHILRHTTATNLLRNGCPVGFIKEILGHERLETTCRFYLGSLDKTETRRADAEFLNFEVSHTPGIAAGKGSDRPEGGRGATPP